MMEGSTINHTRSSNPLDYLEEDLAKYLRSRKRVEDWIPEPLTEEALVILVVLDVRWRDLSASEVWHLHDLTLHKTPLAKCRVCRILQELG